MEAGLDWSEPDVDWAIYAATNNIRLPSKDDVLGLDAIEPAVLNVAQGREAQSISQRAWTSENPLSSVGYESRLFAVKAPYGTDIPVKLSWPRNRGKSSTDHYDQSPSLPVLFVTHGGGFIQGSHVSEEQWLLWPLYERQDLIIVSVEYRLAPEHKFPAWIDDAWYVLRHMIANPNNFVTGKELALDLDNIILAGSSTGGCISAVLSQRCRDEGIAGKGVILNVPVLCDYRHLPRADILKLNKTSTLSYEQCTRTVLDSSVMKAVWQFAVPSATLGSDPHVSPLLGRVDSLPTHMIFVAGHDPVRDEAVLYAHKLRRAGVPVDFKMYNGVPHTFAETHELMSTKMFWDDIRNSLTTLLKIL